MGTPTLKIPPELERGLELASREEHPGKSELVRRALAASLADACLIRMSELYAPGLVRTLDRQRFSGVPPSQPR